MMSESQTCEYIETSSGLWDGDLYCTSQVSDELLAGSFLRFKEEGLSKYIWYEGQVSLTWFMEHFTKARGVEVLAVGKQNAGGAVEMVGLGWLNSKTSIGSVLTKFDVGWAAFKKWHDFSTTVRAGRLMAEYSFRSLGATALFGSTPVKNRAAVLAAGRVGFELYGPVPNYTVWEGEPCAVMISALTKERWERIKEGMTHGATESGNTSRADSNAGCAAKSAA